MKVYWAVLMERTLGEPEANALLNVAEHNGRLGYTRLHHPYAATDVARNRLTEKFLELSEDPLDAFVMLDQDHLHPAHVVERLVFHSLPLVSALCFRRVTPLSTSLPEPLMYERTGQGTVKLITEWTPGELVPCAMAGFGAIAIRRQVFDRLAALQPAPFFRHEYKDGSRRFVREDESFGYLCHQAGIRFICDTGLISPHVTWDVLDDVTWEMVGGQPPKPNTPIPITPKPPPDLAKKALGLPAMVTRLDV